MKASNAEAHPFTIDPIFEELQRILIIIQNPDGSWGVGSSLDDRLYPTGWAAFTSETLQLSLPIRKVETLISTQIILQIEEKFRLSRWLHVKKLCGFFLLLPTIFRAKLWKDRKRFLSNLEFLFERLESQDWINPQIASYLAFSCSSISELKKTAKKARNFLKEQNSIPFQQCAYVSLGYPDVLNPYLEDIEKFSLKLDELTDEQLAHVFLALSFRKDLVNEKLKWTIAKVKEITISRLRNRHITEIDRKVTKEFLDLLLLLRTDIPFQELKRRMKHLNNQLFIRRIESTDKDIVVTTKIPLGRLHEILGRIDIPVMCCYLLGCLKMGERKVFLVPEKDYVQVKNYFREREPFLFLIVGFLLMS